MQPQASNHSLLLPINVSKWVNYQNRAEAYNCLTTAQSSSSEWPVESTACQPLATSVHSQPRPPLYTHRPGQATPVRTLTALSVQAHNTGQASPRLPLSSIQQTVSLPFWIIVTLEQPRCGPGGGHWPAQAPVPWKPVQH